MGISSHKNGNSNCRIGIKVFFLGIIHFICLSLLSIRALWHALWGRENRLNIRKRGWTSHMSERFSGHLMWRLKWRKKLASRYFNIRLSSRLISRLSSHLSRVIAEQLSCELRLSHVGRFTLNCPPARENERSASTDVAGMANKIFASSKRCGRILQFRTQNGTHSRRNFCQIHTKAADTLQFLDRPWNLVWLPESVEGAQLGQATPGNFCVAISLAA